ncbi:MAG TPA: hypothetical protein VF556_09780 [Pyrinomonadaceae bacterium]|jgi:ribosomal protein S7
MPESRRFQNAVRSLNQINAWQEEQEAKELKQKLLIIEKMANEYIDQLTKENSSTNKRKNIQRPGLW